MGSAETNECPAPPRRTEEHHPQTLCLQCAAVPWSGAPSGALHPLQGPSTHQGMAWEPGACSTHPPQGQLLPAGPSSPSTGISVPRAAGERLRVQAPDVAAPVAGRSMGFVLRGVRQQGGNEGTQVRMWGRAISTDEMGMGIGRNGGGNETGNEMGIGWRWEWG